MSDRGKSPTDPEDAGLGVLDGSADQQHLLREHAEQLGVTIEELAIALEQLALQAEVVLHRLRGSPTH